MREDERVLVTGEPQIGVGEYLRFISINPVGIAAQAKLQFLDDWGVFKGALLGIVIDDEQSEIIGTAFFVAPGLAVSATHVLIDVIEDIISAKLKVICFGIHENVPTLWRIEKFICSETDDICFLALSPMTAVPNDRTYYRFTLSTRAPRNGEQVVLIGFRNGSANENSDELIAGLLLVAKGPVVAVHPYRRDNVLMPFPTIHVDAGSLGGMSGGLVLDEQGFVLGVISRGFDTADQVGPTFAGWITPALNRRVEITWPRSLLKEPTSILDIDHKLIQIEGREYIESYDELNIRFRVWFDRKTGET